MGAFRNVAFLCVLLPLLSCSPSIHEKDPHTLHITLRGEFLSQDPLLCNDETCGSVFSFLHRRLYSFSKDGILKPDLVASEKVLPGRVEITLRKPIHFSGVNTDISLSTQDVVFCLERAMKEKRHQWILRNIHSLRNSGKGKITVFLDSSQPMDILRTRQVWGDLRIRMAMPQVSIYSADFFSAEKKFIGAGNYLLESYNSRQVRLSRERSSDVSIHNVVIHTLSDDSARWFFFQRDYFDIYEADGVFRFLPHNPEKYRALDIPELMVLYGAIVYPENGKSILADATFRRALNHGMNRKAIAEKVLSGAYFPADYPVPPELSPPPGGRYPFRERNLTSLAYPDEVIAIYTPPDRERQNVARVIRHILEKKFHLKTKLHVYDLPTLVRFNNERKAGIYLFKWIADYPHPSNFLSPLFHSRNAGMGGNRAYYSNSAVDALLDKGDFSDDAVAKIQKAIQNDAPWVFFGFSRQRYFLSHRFSMVPPSTYLAWADAVNSAVIIRGIPDIPKNPNR